MKQYLLALGLILVVLAVFGCGKALDSGGGSTTVPSVTSVSPTSGATNVSTTSAISAVFSLDMDSASITASTFTLVSSTGAVTGSVLYSSSGKTATFTPSGNLLNNTTYTATVSASVKSSAGIQMASAYTWSFTTAVSTASAAIAVGELDTSFNSVGYLITRESIVSLTCKQIEVSSNDGVIAITGGTNVPLIKVKSDGSYDSSFGTNGRASDASGATPLYMTIDVNSNIFVIGHKLNATFDAVIYKFGSDGVQDNSFSVTYDSGGTDLPAKLKMDSSGNLILLIQVGSAFRIVKFTSGGSLISYFDVSGFTAVNSFLLDSSDNLFIVGWVTNGSDRDAKIAKYKSDGTLDTSFNGQGYVTYSAGTLDSFNEAKIDSLGNLVAVGSTYDGSDTKMLVLRYKSDGTLDTTFNGQGYVLFNGSSNYDAGRSLAFDGNGNMVIAGQGGTDLDVMVFRYKPEGVLDASFNGGQGYIVFINTGTDIANDIKIDSQGKIVVGADLYDSAAGTTNLGIIRYK